MGQAKSLRLDLSTGPCRIYPFDALRLDFWPVSTPTGQSAVIGLAFDRDERPAKPATLVETVGASSLSHSIGSISAQGR